MRHSITLVVAVLNGKHEKACHVPEQKDIIFNNFAGKMIGVILCGGQSTRMGSDKGLLKHQSTTWTQIAIDKFDGLNIPVVISLNEKQYKNYSSVFSSGILVEDDKSIEMRGPLAGVLSAHLKHPREDLMILACDMLLMETGLLEGLLSRYERRQNFDALIYLNGSEPEPLCGIYTTNALNKILHLYQANQLPTTSMKQLLAQINTFSIPLPDDKKKCFKNLNSREDLNSL